MITIEKFIESITQDEEKRRVEEIIQWITNQFPELQLEIKWNQPMFTHHKTFIIALSISKQHIAIAPEMKTIEHFTQEIKEARYDYSPNLLRIRWKDDIPYELLKRMIEYNLADKANNIQFWR